MYIKKQLYQFLAPRNNFEQYLCLVLLFIPPNYDQKIDSLPNMCHTKFQQSTTKFIQFQDKTISTIIPKTQQKKLHLYLSFIFPLLSRIPLVNTIKSIQLITISLTKRHPVTLVYTMHQYTKFKGIFYPVKVTLQLYQEFIQNKWL